MSYRKRGHRLWYAYVLHRVSGLLLALFLPVHFLVLSQIMSDPIAGQLFDWLSGDPLLKVIEVVLVFLLSVHFFGGLRLLALEWLPWSGRHKAMAAGAIAGSAFVATTFFLQAV